MAVDAQALLMVLDQPLFATLAHIARTRLTRFASSHPRIILSVILLSQIVEAIQLVLISTLLPDSRVLPAGSQQPSLASWRLLVCIF